MTKRKRTTTPEEEGIELRPDAWKRFEHALKTIGRHKPKDRAEKEAKRKRTR